MSSRRRLLQTLGVGIVPFAGCGNQADPPATRSETTVPTDSPTDTPTDTPTETEPPVRDQPCDTGWDPAVRWSIRTGDRAFEPAVEDGTLYFGDMDHFRAVDADSGDVNWKVEQPDPVLSRRPQVESSIGVFSNSNQVVGLDIESGDKRWSFDPPGDHASVTAVTDIGETCYVGANQHAGTEQEVDEEYDRVYGLDRKTGNRIFTKDIGDDDRWFPPDELATAGQRVYVGAHRGQTLALDATSGEILWELEIGEYAEGFAVGSGLLFRNDGSKLYALAPDSGQIRWTTDVTEGESPAFGTHVYLLHEGILSAFDPDTGDPVWHSRVPGDTFTGTAVIDSTVYVSRHGSTESDGRLYAFDAETGCRRGYFSTNSTEVTTPAGSDDLIFFGGLNGEGRLWAVTPP